LVESQTSKCEALSSNSTTAKSDNSLKKIPKNKLNKGSEKDLYNENYKSLKKEFRETSEDGKISHAHGLSELIL
jgi:hypothetical protein